MAQVFANPLQMIGWNLKYHNERTSFHIELKLPDFKPFFASTSDRVGNITTAIT